MSSSRRKSADSVLLKRQISDMDMDDGSMSGLTMVKEEKSELDEELDKCKEMLPRPRGRTRSLTKKPADKADIKAKLERSRQSARECRARKKLRYQYLEEIILESEKAIFKLRKELETLKIWGKEIDEGRLPDGIIAYKQSCESGQLGGVPKSDTRMDPKYYMQEQPQQQVQQIQQQQQQLGISPSGFGGSSLSPLASGLSLSPGSGGMNYFTIGTPTNSSNPVLTSILGP